MVVRGHLFACRHAQAGTGALWRTWQPYPYILEPVPENATAGDCGLVYGELLTFDDPETRLPAIDRLEGFLPGGSSLYKRVLVPVCISGQIIPAWVFVGVQKHWARRLLPHGTWPE